MNAPNFRRHLRNHRSALIGVTLLLGLEAVVTSLLPLPVIALIDGILVPADPATVSGLRSVLVEFVSRIAAENGLQTAILSGGGALIGLTALAAALEYVGRIHLTRVAYSTVENLREDLVGRLMTRRQAYIERKRKAELVARLSSDASTAESLISNGLSTLARAVPTLVLLLVVLIALSPRLALLLLFALPLSYVLSLRFSRGMRAHVARLRAETQHFESEAARLFSSAPVVKSLTLESLALRSLHERLEEMGRHIVNLRRADGALTAALSGSRQFLRAIFLVLGGFLVVRGELSLGSLAVFLVAVGPLSRAVGSMAQLATDYGRTETSLERIESLYRELEGQEEQQGSQAFISLPFPDATTLHFDEVTFAYPNSPPLLDRFSASVQAGDLVILMGASGSGRTTFGRLINRLLDPIEGRLLLGRTDLKRYRLDVLRSYVTVVESEPFFIPGTVRDNLLLGAETSEVREQHISEALHAANATDFVQALPEGLETVIGEGGFELSSSQMRRLSFARALLRDNSQIFVLDDPTLGLDPESATSITDAINRLAERGAMVFWITNRIEEAPLADRVMLFHRHRNPVVGTHQELLERDSTYRSYANSVGGRTRPSRTKQIKSETIIDPVADTETEADSITDPT